MESKAAHFLFPEWLNEFDDMLQKSKSLCVALFSTNKELLYANDSMNTLFKGDPITSFINPSFDHLLSLHSSTSPIFEGFLTLGDFASINTSIWAQVYRKKNQLLVLGGVISTQLIEQNEAMHQLNRENSNLQRDLIKEKHILENTLNQLNEANKELNKINADKDRFISILAHDLKGSFNTLLGYSEILSENVRNYDADTIEGQVAIINKTTANAYELLEDILSWARVQSGKFPFVPNKLNFLSVCNEVVESIKTNAIAKHIAISIFIETDFNIFADVNMLKTILRNLISNAIKFSHKGGKIDISSITDHKNLTITIADSGIGINAETMAKLFDISQIHTTNGTDYEKGTGLGLLLCKEFVEKHGGKIWAESEIGKGSTFKFTIPLPT